MHTGIVETRLSKSTCAPITGLLGRDARVKVRLRHGIHGTF